MKDLESKIIFWASFYMVLVFLAVLFLFLEEEFRDGE